MRQRVRRRSIRARARLSSSPTSASRRMPAYMLGTWNTSCELRVRKPSPECAPIISAATRAVTL
ncbi:hypothetical protein D3C78_1993090 [compost metagenome]